MTNIDLTQMITPQTAHATQQERLLRLLAETRWQKETEGVDVTGLARFQSDRTTRAELASLIGNIELGVIDDPVTWKALSGWEVLGKDQLRQVLWLINAHVQASFAAERRVAEQILSDKISTAQDMRQAFQHAYEAARFKNRK